MGVAPQIRVRRSPQGAFAPGSSRPKTGLGRLLTAIAGSCSGALLVLTPLDALASPDAVDITQAVTAPGKDAEAKSPAGTFLMETFLDRLMAAESGGRLDAKNPRSTALGPFQFIESTFLFVAKRYLSPEIASLTEEQILALRTNLEFSRRAARAYVDHLMGALGEQGLPTTMVNLRLAFLVGPIGAVRLLKAPPNQPLKDLLSADAIAANPFMSGKTAADLVTKAAYDVGPSADRRALAALGRGRGSLPAKPAFEIKCLITLAPCRKWVAMQERKVARLTRSAER